MNTSISARILLAILTISSIAAPATADTFGWAVGNNGAIRHTTDGGATPWTAQTSGTIGALQATDFADAQNGWIVGVLNNSILHTANGGATWGPQPTPANLTLFGVDFVDASNGWAVGNLAVILNTSNGGTTWTEQTRSPTSILRDLSFVDTQNGWAAGDRQAAAFRAILQRRPWTHRHLADLLCISHQTITRALALLDLPRPVQLQLERGNLSVSTAYEISKLKSPDEQLAMAEQVQSDRLARSVEGAARSADPDSRTARVTSTPPQPTPAAPRLRPALQSHPFLRRLQRPSRRPPRRPPPDPRRPHPSPRSRPRRGPHPR